MRGATFPKGKPRKMWAGVTGIEGIGDRKVDKYILGNIEVYRNKYRCFNDKPCFPVRCFAVHFESCFGIKKRDYNAILNSSVHKERNFKSTFFPEQRYTPATRYTIEGSAFRNCVSSRLLTGKSLTSWKQPPNKIFPVGIEKLRRNEVAQLLLTRWARVASFYVHIPTNIRGKYRVFVIKTYREIYETKSSIPLIVYKLMYIEAFQMKLFI